MHHTEPYTQQIKTISLTQGVKLNDEQALEVLARMVELVKVTHQPKPHYGRKHY